MKTADDKTAAWVLRASSLDETRPRMCRSYVTRRSSSDATAIRVATDGHRLHLGPAPAGLEIDVDCQWILAPVNGAPNVSTKSVVFSFPNVTTIANLRQACDLADAIADLKFHEGRAEAIREAVMKSKAPSRDSLPDRESPALIIDGQGYGDDVCVNANYFRDAIHGLPRTTLATGISVKVGGALDPIVITRGNELAIIMPMKVNIDDRTDWPKIGTVGA